jgi:hypothetical protein
MGYGVSTICVKKVRLNTTKIGPIKRDCFIFSTRAIGTIPACLVLKVIGQKRYRPSARNA